MRIPWVTSAQALHERVSNPAQLPADVPDASMPPYMASYLAHLRLLIGVPFEYLVPDARLLPNESIRFFFLDRSWTDRLVDGALAVGKIGSREQAHHQEHAPAVASQLDMTERIVRAAQRGKIDDFAKAQTAASASERSGGIVTGFLMRSAAVAGWPSMDVCAYSQIVHPPAANSDLAALRAWRVEAEKHRIATLRHELLAPGVMLVLFDGIPKLVWCEQPHHGVQFGVEHGPRGLVVTKHTRYGSVEDGQHVAVPVRKANSSVISASGLRRNLYRQIDPALPAQTGGAAFAIEVLDLPWRQRFENAPPGQGARLVAHYALAERVALTDVGRAFTELVR